MIRDPTDIPSVEQRDEDEFFCSMCTVHFDREAFELADQSCPGCAHMEEQQRKMRQRGQRGAL